MTDIAAGRNVMAILGGGVIGLLAGFAAESFRCRWAKRRRLRSSTPLPQLSALSPQSVEARFLATMNHELRTPLNAIMGFAELLEREPFGPLGDARYRGYVRSIRGAGDRLNATIADLLDFAEIEAGGFVPQLVPVEPEGLIAECIRAVVTQAGRAEITVTAELAATESVWADREALKQALLRLLFNAIKFTPPGGRVALGAERVGRNIRFTIADNGIGMRAEDIELACRPFRQLDTKLARNYEGTGLGLPLAKRLIELQGGTFRIRSEPLRGTEIAITLPVHRPGK